MKLVFEIAVDQQTKAHDQTFEGVPDSGCPPVHAGQPRPYLLNFGSILPNRLNMLKIKFYQNRIKIGRVMSKILYVHIWAYAKNIIDFGP